MKITKQLIILLAIAQIQISCKKSWLDSKPSQDLAVPSTLQDAQALLDNNDRMNYIMCPTLAEIGSDDHYVTDATFNRLSNYEKNAYTWSHQYPYNNIFDWLATYVRVYYSNLVLETLSKIHSDSDYQQWNDIKGQALFFRAMSIYQAALQWAPVFDSTTADTDLGVPLRSSSDIAIATTRSTLKQTYESAITDLVEASTLLNSQASYKSRPSRPAVFALLARIYLSVGDYIDAKRYTDSCLSLYNTLLNYNSLLSNAAPAPGLYNDEVLFHSVMFYPLSLQGCFIDSNLYSSYDSTDLRRVIFFVNRGNNQIKFQGNYSQATALFFNGLATDEVYLIRAECNARLGNTNAAMNDLNALLVKRWKTDTFIPFTAINSEDALTKILKERRKELIMRGLRWSDLKRLNKDPRFAVTITRTVGGQTYTLSQKSFKYALPIPDDIIKQSGIPQNIGW